MPYLSSQSRVLCIPITTRLSAGDTGNLWHTLTYCWGLPTDGCGAEIGHKRNCPRFQPQWGQGDPSDDELTTFRAHFTCAPCPSFTTPWPQALARLLRSLRPAYPLAKVFVTSART